MARQVVFGAKGSTAYILESAVAANLRLARSEVGSDGSAQVTSLPLTGAQTEIMGRGEAFTCLQVSVNSGVAPPPAKRLPAVVPGPPPVHALARFDGQQEYLEFVAGDLILIREPPPGADAAGWSYGYVPRTGATGWYPPTYAR